MQIQKNDFVYFFDVITDKTEPLLVTSVKGDTIKGYIADNTAAFDSTRQEREVSVEYVRANVGDDPVYWMNKPVQLFRGTTEVKRWGVNIWMTPVTEKGAINLERSIKKLMQVCKTNSIHPYECETHILLGTPNDRNLGMYYYRPKSIDIMEVKLQNDLLPLHVLAHEYAHGLWWRVMSDKERARWVKLYLKCVSRDDLGDNIQKSVLDDMRKIDSGDGLNKLRKDYRSQDIDVSQIITDIFSYIKRAHCLTKKDIKTLLDAKESIAPYLPDSIVSLKSHATTGVTDYANKEAAEFWCESFALFATDQNLPQHVVTRMANCIVSLQASR